MEYGLTIENVSKRFGEFVAVDNLSLKVPKGSIYGFIGPNGAGKTTTIRMIMSIFYPDSGTLNVLGHGRAEDVKDRIGYLPEEKGLYKKMRAAEIITYFGELKGMTRIRAKDRALELLRRYGLGEWINARCETLSKGMQQKVQILGAIVHDPELIILDEPLTGLDPVNVEVMRELVLDLKRAGKTVIFCTHIMAMAEQICDFIMLINRGRKILDGPLAEIRRSGDYGIQIDYDGDGHILRSLHGVSRISDAGKTAEIFLEAGVDPQDILRQLVGRLVIRRFDLREPSLQEVFVRAVGGKSDE